MTRIVPFEGDMKSKIYLVGESPGEREVALSRPFVGGSGKILDRILVESGIRRDECRMGNVMRTRPPGNNFKKQFYNGNVPTKELEDGREYLISDIKKSEANVVVALGNEALLTLLGESGISNWRGSIIWGEDIERKVIPTFHPASIMRNWDYLPLTLLDMKKARVEGEMKELIKVDREFIISPTFELTLSKLEGFRGSKRIAFDVETSGNLLSSIAISDHPLSAICIPFTIYGGKPYWSEGEEMIILEELKKLMEDERVEKVAQNAQFDNIILLVNPPYIQVSNLIIDTMVAFNAIYPELPKSLATLTSIYTRQPYYKHWIHTNDMRQFWTYNATDASVTLECAYEIEKEMKEFGVREHYYKYIHPLLSILSGMQVRGIKIDRDVRDMAAKETERDIVEMQGKLDFALGREVNVMSPKQLKELLYEDMGLPAKYKRGTKNLTTDERAISELSSKYPSPIFSFILSIRQKRKLLSTYLSDKTDSDGRMRCSYLIGGTESGRLSSRGSIFGSGGNLQNIPKGICREMYVPDEGKVFVEADLSQADFRVVAYLSEDEKLIDLLESGEDIYVQIAAWIYGVGKGEINKDMRTIAKRSVHGLNYGMGATAFAYHIGKSVGDARSVKEKYFTVFPKIRLWQMSVQSALGKSRTMSNPLGRKRTFFARWGDNLFREALAFVPQSTVADILSATMINLNQSYGGLEFMLQIHDSIVVQIPKGEVDMWVERLLYAFKRPVPIFGRELIIPAEVMVGKNWGEMNEVKIGGKDEY